jgi:hypothetical protein
MDEGWDAEEDRKGKEANGRVSTRLQSAASQKTAIFIRSIALDVGVAYFRNSKDWTLCSQHVRT